MSLQDDVAKLFADAQSAGRRYHAAELAVGPHMHVIRVHAAEPTKRQQERRALSRLARVACE